jgi:hypothetical protein
MTNWLSRWGVSNSDFPELILPKLDSDQIQHFINRWHDLTFNIQALKVGKKERLQQAIQRDSAIRELAENPVVLMTMAIANRTEELPKNKPSLYKKVSEVLLHQWDLDSTRINHKDKEAMLCQVACHIKIANNGLPNNLIEREDLERILTGYLENIKVENLWLQEDEITQGRTVARLLIKELQNHNSILPLLGTDS